MARLAATSRAALLACASAFLPVHGHATEFQLNPLRVALSAAKPIDAFRLTNVDALPVRVQLSLQAWSQTEAGDDYKPTPDLLANPPLFVAPSKATQTIRVGLRGVQPGPVEKAYRAFFQEVPDPAKETGGVQTLLRISVPVFVPPLESRPAQVDFRMGRDAVILHNPGNAHVQVTNIAVSDASHAKVTRGLSVYILAGQSATIPFAPGALPGDADHVELVTDAGKLTAVQNATVPR